MSEEKNKGGRPRKLESPIALLDYFKQYVKEEFAKPILVTDWVGKDSIEVQRQKYVSLTMQGFNCWLFERNIIHGINDYITNKDGEYNEFSEIITYIKDFIFNHNFKGASVNELNPNLIARQLSIKETSEVSVDAKVTNTNLTPEQAKKLAKDLDSEY